MRLTPLASFYKSLTKPRHFLPLALSAPAQAVRKKKISITVAAASAIRKLKSSTWLLVLVLLAFVASSWIFLACNRPDNIAERTSRFNKSSKVYSNETEIAWLLSFPNSGTTFTLMITQHLTNRSVATNYEMDIPFSLRSGTRINSAVNAPYQLNTSLQLPHPLILTKTHCSGYSMRRLPVKFSEDFHCHRFRFMEYNASMVHKAVHLFRNPFDNIVARMHLYGSLPRNEHIRKNISETPEGLLTWCQYLDNKIPDVVFDSYMQSTGNGPLSAVSTSRLGSFKVVSDDLYRDLPCRTEWLRYVQWHNMAIELTDEDLKLPVYYLYYEDYSYRYDDTIQSLLEFLELDKYRKQKHEDDGTLRFIPGKTYGHMYSKELMSKAKQFMQALATPACWQRIRHYF